MRFFFPLATGPCCSSASRREEPNSPSFRTASHDQSASPATSFRVARITTSHPAAGLPPITRGVACFLLLWRCPCWPAAPLGSHSTHCTQQYTVTRREMQKPQSFESWHHRLRRRVPDVAASGTCLFRHRSSGLGGAAISDWTSGSVFELDAPPCEIFASTLSKSRSKSRSR